MVKRVARVLLALAMVSVGLLHFVKPEGFIRIVPEALPWPRALVYVSGVFEVLLGASILPERSRKLAAYGLVALYLAVFPANINMAIHHIQLDPANPLPIWAMWARLPFQALFIAYALWVGDVWPRPPPRAP